MAVSESELVAILDHCRSLVGVAEAYDAAARARAGKATVATRLWAGPHRLTFDGRFGDEGSNIFASVAGLRDEADAWARIWADTVNRENEQRREDAVNQISSSRGFGESFVDVFVGDDSGDQVAAVQPVLVPTAESGFAATGGLENY